MSDFPQYKQQAVEDLIPYARNARTHSDEQVDKIAASIREFGFLNPVITDGDNGIVAGHGRIMAAKKLGMDEVPTVEAAHLTDAQKRAYILADNRLALDAGWDDELLQVEFAELEAADFDISLTGFDPAEIKALEADYGDDGDNEENPYSTKVDAPHYEPVGDKPALSDVYDTSKTTELFERIEASEVSDEDKRMLKAAAYRHTVFDFEQVANYYAHSEPEVQELMEDSAMVIIDFDKAIAEGYVTMTNRLSALFEQDQSDE